MGPRVNAMRPSPIKGSEKFRDFTKHGMPESPIFRNKGANQPDNLFGAGAYQQIGAAKT